MADRRFSKQGQPATDFERDLLLQSQALEDPWVEIAQIIGLDAALAVMDRFERCLLSCPSRTAFITRMHRVWLDIETLRLRHKGAPNRRIVQQLGVTDRSIRKRVARAKKHLQSKRG